MSRWQQWWCRQGFHGSTFIDGARFTSAKRCNHCLEWVDPDEGARVDAEREYWSNGGCGWRTALWRGSSMTTPGSPDGRR